MTINIYHQNYKQGTIVQCSGCGRIMTPDQDDAIEVARQHRHDPGQRIVDWREGPPVIIKGEEREQ